MKPERIQEKVNHNSKELGSPALRDRLMRLVSNPEKPQTSMALRAVEILQKPRPRKYRRIEGLLTRYGGS